MEKNDSEKIVENLVITNEIISRYKEPNSSLKVRDITFKNCILYLIDLYFHQNLRSLYSFPFVSFYLHL